MNRKFKIYLLAQLLAIIIISGQCSAQPNKKVILTFDDGPHPGITPRILKILKEHDVKATFFLVGVMVKKHPDLVKQIHESGFEIGNHTYSDIRLINLDRKNIATALESTNDLLEVLTGKRTIFFRPPGGRYNSNVLEVAHDLGYYIVLWSRHVSDTTPGITEDEVFRRATKNAAKNELIMMHDGPEATIKALPGVISFYKERGYEFVTLSRDTPPMFHSMVKKENNLPQLSRFPDGMDLDDKNTARESIPGDVIATFAIFASISGTFFFVRTSRLPHKGLRASFVFIGGGADSVTGLMKELTIKGISGTFFVDPDTLDKLRSPDNELDENHTLACLNPGSDHARRSIQQWKEGVLTHTGPVLPLYYTDSGYSESTVEEIKAEGFLPVSWRINPPDRNLQPLLAARYVLSRIKGNQVIPFMTDSPHTPGALELIIDSMESGRYRIMALDRYLAGHLPN